MWALILTYAVFLNAIDFSSQVSGKRKKEKPPKIAEAFVLDSGHDSQVQPQHVPYTHVSGHKRKQLADPQNFQRQHGQQSAPVNQYDLNIHSYHHEDFPQKAADVQQAQEAQQALAAQEALLAQQFRAQQALLALQARAEQQAQTPHSQSGQDHPLMHPNLYYNRYFGKN